ncbi:metallophosphoesterase [Brachybacterium sp.]|uniref:metallophosphoesterase n=1 Tax=Brachybacterium sp. TaxID=1891286 RepID=UPI002ED1BBB6
MSAPLSVAPRGGHAAAPLRSRLARAALVGILVLLLGAGWLLWDNRRLDLTQYDVPLASLPAAADGLRIAQVSDLHAADFGSFQDRLISGVESGQPDLIALTGDLIDHRTADISGVLDVAERLWAIAPTYMVLGNHEADSPRQSALLTGLEERGVVVLRDESTTVQVAGAVVTLIGLDDPRVRAAAGLSARDPAALLSALSPQESALTILLAHRPELFERYLGEGIDLVLSGHAHGGQVRVPGIGGLYAPHQGWLPELSEGVHERQGTTMVISRGLGNSIAGVRVNDPRELVLIDLRRAG